MNWPRVLLLGFSLGFVVLYLAVKFNDPQRKREHWDPIGFKCRKCAHEFTLHPRELSRRLSEVEDFREEYIGTTECPKCKVPWAAVITEERAMRENRDENGQVIGPVAPPLPE